MPKIVKYALIAVGGLIGILIIVAIIIAATFDPNDYKPQIIKLVQEKKQRTLSIPGEIKLTFFPKIGADLGRISISEHKSDATFASMESARVSLALIPLFSKRFVVDRIKIDGLAANLKRYKDGSTNFDDLLVKDEQQSESGQQVKFAIDGVSISNANVSFDDQRASRKLELSKLNLMTGEIANGKSSKFDLSTNLRSNNPSLDAQVAIKSGFNLDLEQKHYVLNGLDAELKGQAAGYSDVAVHLQGNGDLKSVANQFTVQDLKLSATGKQAAETLEVQLTAPKLALTDQKVSGGTISGEVKMSEPGRNLEASLAAPSFEGTPQSFTIPSLAVDARLKQGELNAQAKLAGTISGDVDKLLFTSPQLSLNLDGKQGATAMKGALTTPLAANLKSQVIELAKISADFVLPNPAGGSLALKATGNASLNLSKQTLSAALDGKLDQSTITAKFGLNKFSPPVYTFNIAIDQIDADRYMKKSTAAATPAKGGAETPIDLSALKDLNAHGTLKIGALKVANIKASNVRLDIHAAGGKIDVNPLAANLYQGSLAGSLSLAAAAPPRFVVKQQLSNVAIGPLLKDAIDKDPIEGRGNVRLDISTQGATVSALKKGLNGTARLDLRDGAVRGVNIAETIRNAKATLSAVKGDQQSGTASANAKTDFSELSGSFRLTNGVAHNDDLSAKSPLLRVGGNGDINIPNSSLDYTVRATIVPSLQGQGGQELQGLKGVTIPVHLDGPLTAMNWKVDFTAMAQGLAKQKIDEKKEEMKGKVQEKLQDKLKGLFGR